MGPAGLVGCGRSPGRRAGRWACDLPQSNRRSRTSPKPGTSRRVGPGGGRRRRIAQGRDLIPRDAGHPALELMPAAVVHQLGERSDVLSGTREYRTRARISSSRWASSAMSRPGWRVIQPVTSLTEDFRTTADRRRLVRSRADHSSKHHHRSATGRSPPVLGKGRDEIHERFPIPPTAWPRHPSQPSPSAASAPGPTLAPVQVTCSPYRSGTPSTAHRRRRSV